MRAQIERCASHVRACGMGERESGTGMAERGGTERGTETTRRRIIVRPQVDRPPALGSQVRQSSAY